MVRIALRKFRKVGIFLFELLEEFLRSLFGPVDIILRNLIREEELLEPIPIVFPLKPFLYLLRLFFQFCPLRGRCIWRDRDINFAELRVVETIFAFKSEAASASRAFVVEERAIVTPFARDGLDDTDVGALITIGAYFHNDFGNLIFAKITADSGEIEERISADAQDDILGNHLFINTDNHARNAEIVVRIFQRARRQRCTTDIGFFFVDFKDIAAAEIPRIGVGKPVACDALFCLQIKHEFIGEGLLVTRDEMDVARCAHEILVKVCPNVVRPQNDVAVFDERVAVDLDEIIMHHHLIAITDDDTRVGCHLLRIQPLGFLLFFPRFAISLPFRLRLFGCCVFRGRWGWRWGLGGFLCRRFLTGVRKCFFLCLWHFIGGLRDEWYRDNKEPRDGYKNAADKVSAGFQ